MSKQIRRAEEAAERREVKEVPEEALKDVSGGIPPVKGQPKKCSYCGSASEHFLWCPYHPDNVVKHL